MNAWDDWIKHVGAVPPLGYLLRERLPRRWLRVHSLPGSKRLPKTARHLEEALRRMNTVASAVLGIGAECVLFTADKGLRGQRALPTWKIGKTRKQDLEEAGLTFHHESVRWIPGALDTRLRERAMDKCWPFAVFSLATHGVFIPYDGGADLFVRHARLVGPTKALFEDWLPARPPGL